MRLALSGGRTVELGYCYNVLPGETVAALIDQVRRICGPVRARLGVARLGVGLWIARGAATELRDPTALRALAGALDDAGLYCFTLNGFPYGGFHAPRVKHAVFEPSWADPARAEYTIDLAEILAALLPDDLACGSISTLPLGPASVDRVAARAGLARAADALAGIAARTGRSIELAIEPEPGAAFERADELARYLSDDRDPGRLPLAALGLGVCLDCCHAAVVGEEPAAAFAAMAAAGVRCAKIQISSALVAARPDDRLAALDEPRFLHQVRSDRGGAMDLPEALATLDRGSPWRIHFHVPVHRDEVAGLATTRASIVPVLEAALAPIRERAPEERQARSARPERERAPEERQARSARIDRPPHLEVETYTWSVLPAGERAGGDAELVDGIAREMQWTIDRLSELGARP